MPVMIVFAFLLLYALEFVRPVVARTPIRTWVWRVWFLNALQATVLLMIGTTWHFMQRGPSLLHLSRSLNCVTAGSIAYLAYTFVFYWWHRARHESDWLWRTLHQIHHSPRRLEAVTAFYKHPLETVANGLIAGVLLFCVLGLDTKAAAMCVMLATLADIFYHANVRTPSWVGWFLQRPEMHRLHHEFDRHHGNYGDLPLWDAAFGTLRQPCKEPVRCGFAPEREERLGEMLQWRDVHHDAP